MVGHHSRCDSVCLSRKEELNRFVETSTGIQYRIFERDGVRLLLSRCGWLVRTQKKKAKNARKSKGKKKKQRERENEKKRGKKRVGEWLTIYPQELACIDLFTMPIYEHILR
jgi:hypothetical protein